MSPRVWLGRQVRPPRVRMGTPELNCNKRARVCRLCVLCMCALCTGSAIIGRIDLLMAQDMVRYRVHSLLSTVMRLASVVDIAVSVVLLCGAPQSINHDQEVKSKLSSVSGVDSMGDSDPTSVFLQASVAPLAEVWHLLRCPAPPPLHCIGSPRLLDSASSFAGACP